MNHGKYVIGIRLLLLKEYLQANAGKDRIVKRREIEAYLTEKGFPVEKKTLYSSPAHSPLLRLLVASHRLAPGKNSLTLGFHWIPIGIPNPLHIFSLSIHGNRVSKAPSAIFKLIDPCVI